MSKRTVIICDKCREEIKRSAYYIDAGTYGIELHIDCFKELTGFEVIKIFNLDDVFIDNRNSIHDKAKVTSKSSILSI